MKQRPILASLLALSALVAPVSVAPAMAESFQLAQAEGPVSQARSLMMQGRFSQAQQVLESALAKDPDSFSANLMMGQVLDHMAEFEQALKVFKKVADANPDSLEAQVWLGSGYLAAEKYDLCVSVSEKAIAKFEKKATDQELLSRLYVNLAGGLGLKSKREGFFAMIQFGTKVRGNLEKALSINSNSRTLYALGRYYVEAPGPVGGDPKKGVPLISKALQLEPKHPAIRANHIRGLIAAGQKAEAKEQWAKFKADFGDYAKVLAEAKDIDSKI